MLNYLILISEMDALPTIPNQQGKTVYIEIKLPKFLVERERSLTKLH